MNALDFNFVDAIEKKRLGESIDPYWVFEARQFLGKVVAEVGQHGGTVEEVREIVLNADDFARFFHSGTGHKERVTRNGSASFGQR